jgi:4'-phosphopantetheinyl transferase EntD
MRTTPLFGELHRFDGPHGEALLLTVDVESERDDDALHPEEVALVKGASRLRRRLFAGGRHALRTLAGDAGPVLRDERGAPQIAVGMASISHKETIAGALFTREATSERIGFDIEVLRPLRFDIARRVLTERELRDADASFVSHDERVLRTFSAKEAIYKAIDPFVRRYVGFLEVESTAWDEGPTGFRFVGGDDLASLSVEVIQFTIATPIGELICSTARATR